MQLASIPSGHAGTAATVSAMRRLVLRAVASPAVREAARDIFVQAPVRDTVGQAHHLRQWLLDHIIFFRDPDGVELLHTPDWMLHEVGTRGRLMADCDDAAVLAATLAKTAGFPARFVVLGFTPRSGFQHVYTEIFDGRRWVDLDVTRAGYIPTVRRSAVVPI